MEFDEKVKGLLPEDVTKVLRSSYHKVKFWENKLTCEVVNKGRVKPDLRKRNHQLPGISQLMGT